MFNAKFFSGAAYFLLALPLFYYSHTLALPVVMALIAMRCVYEALHVSGFAEAKLLLPAGLLLAGCLPFAACAGGFWVEALCYVYLVAALLLYLFHYNSLALLNALYCMAMTLLLGACFAVPVLTRRLEHGLWLLIFTFVGTWSADTCAQMCGRLFGRHKFKVRVSPNKTVEGCVGSLLATAVVYAALAQLLNTLADTSFSLPLMAAAGLLVSVAGQVGDLLASAVKRLFGVKDFSRLIPGHGGMYDRFDSFALVAPMLYLLAQALPLAG